MAIVYVHGGVAGVRRGSRAALGPAVSAGADAESALDASETAVRMLEDEPTLNAGYGAVLHREGGIELDAGLVDGASGRWAGVAGVDLAHPISLARIVLEQTPHVLITGMGAQALAEQKGLPRLHRSTPEQHSRWESARLDGSLEATTFAHPEHVDTVGAVALDELGNLAAASSTGGVFGKLPGRVGDAPIFGAGIYADEDIAVAGTGVGELFLETLACLRVAHFMEDGLDIQAACERGIKMLRERGEQRATHNAGSVSAGLLALGRDGALGAAFAGATWHVEGPGGPVSATHVT
jgi:L-asparaginase / beta-aspartyl-peptidase